MHIANVLLEKSGVGGSASFYILRRRMTLSGDEPKGHVMCANLVERNASTNIKVYHGPAVTETVLASVTVKFPERTDSVRIFCGSLL
jgi:hypothetical protein